MNLLCRSNGAFGLHHLAASVCGDSRGKSAGLGCLFAVKSQTGRNREMRLTINHRTWKVTVKAFRKQLKTFLVTINVMYGIAGVP